MDFEEAWREAMAEEQAKPNPTSAQQSASVGRVGGNTAASAADQDDPYDEFYDDDLLQSVPFANDTLPVAAMAAMIPPMLPETDLTATAGSSSPKTMATALPHAIAAPTRTLFKTTAASTTERQTPTATLTPPASAAAVPARKVARERKTASPSRGVLNFPPTALPSFMLRGDDGRVRWVTAATGTPAATPHSKAKAVAGMSRKRARAGVDSSAGMEVLDVDGDDATDVNMQGGAEVVEVDSSSDLDSEECGDVVPELGRVRQRRRASSLSASSSSSRFGASEVEEEDDDEAQRRSAPHFLRDGIHVKEMLQELYAEEASKQAELEEKRRRVESEAKEMGRGAPGVGSDEASVPRDPFSTPPRTASPHLSLQQHGATATGRTTHASSNTSKISGAGGHGGGGGELWVTKYSPKLFREVLSDESINLRLLQWLKSWDAYVFPDEPNSNGANGVGGASKSGAGGGVKSLTGGFAASSTKEAAAAVSGSGAVLGTGAAGPPEERIAVLTGPPGVGKTTLVHVLAAHCGYEVIEVNASVERTASRLEALIKTAVSAAGPAPGGRLRRTTPQPAAAASAAAASLNTMASAGGLHGHLKSGAVQSEDEAAASGGASLVQHLLRPKCLVIDEMDGIASSSVATYLMQLQLHRPVFCLCNDFYVPSLRPLRQRCSHVYYLPPIRPQRLLARLEEIARREGMVGLDPMSLSELITMSGGDVRSCLNTMQFINSVIHQQQQQDQQRGSVGGKSGGGSHSAPSQRHTITELIRRMQGKDTRLALKESWQLLFTRPERNKAVQLLKQECGVDYEGLVEAAAAQHHRQHIVESRRRHERERAIGGGATWDDTTTSTVDTNGSYAASALGDASRAASSSPPAQQQPQQNHNQQVALGFRVDPGYLYAAQQLIRCPDTAGLLDGLQENYLDRAYTDYSFLRTATTAASFSQQDVVTTAAFQHPEMLMGTAERLGQVAALTCYVHCSTAARGGRLEFPREHATLRRLQSEAQHVSQQFRGGCRPHIATFLNGDEVTSADVAPMLLRCLFDRALRLPAHAITSFSRLPPADQRLLQASVARHVEYGLNYEKDRNYTAPFGGGGFGAARFGSFLPSNSEDDVPWRLAPELDKLLAGVVRPMEKALHGGRGGSGGSSFFQRSRYGDRNNNNKMFTANQNGGASNFEAHAGGQAGFGSYKSSGGSASASGRPTLSSVLMPLKNEIRQILVGEIRQYQILQSVEFLKKQQEQHQQQKAQQDGLKKTDSLNAGSDDARKDSLTTRGEKRPRDESAVDNAAGAAAATTSTDGATAATASATDSDTTDLSVAKSDAAVEAVLTGKKAKVEDVPGAKPPARTVVRRDFFGRPIPDAPLSANATRNARGAKAASSAGTTPVSHLPSVSPTASPSPTAGNGGGGGSGAFPRSQPPHVPSTQACVRYVYQDGSTNAVKMPAVLADF